MGAVQVVFEGDRGGSDHCACLTGSGPVRKSRDFSLNFFPVLFFPVFFSPYFFFRTFFPVLFFSYYFPVLFFPVLFFPVLFFLYFFLSSSTNVGLGCSLRRPRPIAIGNYTPPFYFHILCVLYDVRVL